MLAGGAWWKKKVPKVLKTRAGISCSINQSHDGNRAVIPLDHSRGSDGNIHAITAGHLIPDAEIIEQR